MMNFPIPPPSYFTPPSMPVPVPNNFTVNQRFLKPDPEKNLNNPNSYVIQPPQMSYGTPPPPPSHPVIASSPFPRLPVGVETHFSNPPVPGQGQLYRPGYECPPAQPLYQQPPPPQMAALNMQLSCPPAGPAEPAAAAPGQEIPDLRPQFLATQYRGQPGQVVVLPPLQGDGSLQTIQILTPAHSTQYSANSANSTPYSTNSTPYTVQTIVLPIMKLQPASTQPTPEQVQEDTAEDSIMASTSTALVSGPAEEEMYLNRIDGTGLPSVMQGIDLDQVKQFAAEFKAARIRLGLTQTQVGQALNSSQVVEDQAACVSQSTICRFEKLEITALQVELSVKLREISQYLENASSYASAFFLIRMLASTFRLKNIMLITDRWFGFVKLILSVKAKVGTINIWGRPCPWHIM